MKYINGFFQPVLSLSALLLLMHSVVFAQSANKTAYITDNFFVPIRSGPGNSFRIIKHNISTGTQLELLPDDNPKDPWSKVRLSNGKEGFIRSQYITTKPIARTQLAELSAAVKQLTSDKRALTDENTALNQHQAELQSLLDHAQNEGSSTSQELERIRRVSSDALQLHSRHQALLERVEVMKTEIDVLQAENGRLLRKEKELWVLLGAGLVLFGVLLTISIQRFRPRKKYSEWA